MEDAAESMLAALFSDRWESSAAGVDGHAATGTGTHGTGTEVFVDRDPVLFTHVLSWLRAHRQGRGAHNHSPHFLSST